MRTYLALTQQFVGTAVVHEGARYADVLWRGWTGRSFEDKEVIDNEDTQRAEQCYGWVLSAGVHNDYGDLYNEAMAEFDRLAAKYHVDPKELLSVCAEVYGINMGYR